MQWHFAPDTGCPFWLERAKSLDFDPLHDVRSVADLSLFPDVADELRDVPVRDLIPRGYGERPDIIGFYESGGTTGPPKRLPLLAEWADQFVGWTAANMESRGVSMESDWLALVPTGPHVFGELIRRQARLRGGTAFLIDMDPRWVKKCLALGHVNEAAEYAAHLIGQARNILETQEIGVLVATPPLLERMARDDRLVELINSQVHSILWSGAHMDADTRLLLTKEVFPRTRFHGGYGSTMILGGVDERVGSADGNECVIDPFSPYITFSVVDPETLSPVAYGERGRVLTRHVSRSMLLPNILERDVATRVCSPAGAAGDSVADVVPLPSVDERTLIEGVY